MAIRLDYTNMLGDVVEGGVSVADWEPTEEEDLMTSYLAGSFGAVPKVSEGQVGRRLLRADELARTEAEKG